MKSVAALIVVAAALSSVHGACNSALSCAQAVKGAISSLQPSRPLAPAQQSALGIAQRMLQPVLEEANAQHFGDGGGSDLDKEWCPNKS